MSEDTISVERKPRSTVSTTPITDAVYPRKGQRPSTPSTPRKPGRGHTISLGSILRQKHGIRAFDQLLDRIEKGNS